MEISNALLAAPSCEQLGRDLPTERRQERLRLSEVGSAKPLGEPQVGLDRHISWISSRTSLEMAGRPGCPSDSLLAPRFGRFQQDGRVLPRRPCEGETTASRHRCLGNAGEIRSFLVVTEMASKSKVIQVVRTVMLPGDDVFNVKGEVGVIALMDPAILTAISSTLVHECSGLVVHYMFGKVDTSERAFNRIKAMKSIYSTYLSYSLASSGERVPSFAFSASSSRRAWNSGLGLGSSAKCLANSGVKPLMRWSTNFPSVVSTD
jgi:hypothetical protein